LIPTAKFTWTNSFLLEAFDYRVQCYETFLVLSYIYILCINKLFSYKSIFADKNEVIVTGESVSKVQTRQLFKNSGKLH
jgi:hypothetical protein